MIYGGYAEFNGKNAEAISAYKKVKEKYPTYVGITSGEVDKRLARLGELN